MEVRGGTATALLRAKRRLVNIIRGRAMPHWAPSQPRRPRRALLRAERRHGDVVIRLVEMRQEEDVEQFELVDGHALLDGE